jgi:catechol 2,3-dioxygenase-like lactoylglutathione lyase family enzyme
MRLQHLALAVRDQRRAMAFYARFFRFDPATARTYPDGVVIVHDPDGFALALGVEDPAERDGPGFPHFGFEMDAPDEVRRLRARLVAAGVELVEDEDTEGYVGFKCLDPDGNVVEVSCEP